MTRVREKNQEATLYVGNLDQRVDEELIWELFIQVAPVVGVYIPKDRITGEHQGYGFIELKSAKDAIYAQMVLNMIKLYDKPLRISKSNVSQKTLDVGANLYIGNLDSNVDEQLLHETFGHFGKMISAPKIIRDVDTHESKGYAFIKYADFESSDRAISSMNNQFFYNKVITVGYAYKNSGQGEKHGSQEERLLAKNKPVQSSKNENNDLKNRSNMQNGNNNLIKINTQSSTFNTSQMSNLSQRLGTLINNNPLLTGMGTQGMHGFGGNNLNILMNKNQNINNTNLQGSGRM
ncbi:splicing factor 3b subunit [Anaeramoeba flamelloides]|uniref:Splicing factor 3b subunit n=1 Tax=Anaeramoeba flamelloides TaxID=1746091 RepID=A0AAV7ZLH4_9EUKA|nr:splicing factor 3b subunit [Anaeramoeba flamelloides]